MIEKSAYAAICDKRLLTNYDQTENGDRTPLNDLTKHRIIAMAHLD